MYENTISLFIAAIVILSNIVCAAETYVAYLPSGCDDSAESKKDVDGIVFRVSSMLPIKAEGESATIGNLDIQAGALYVSGCINSPDSTNPAWGGGDGFKNFFVGDKTGELIISYQSGVKDIVPLVFGYSTFCSKDYKMSPEPFRSDPIAAKVLDDILYVANGLGGYAGDPVNYYIKISLRDQPIKSITLKDSSGRIGYTVVNGLTFSEVVNLEKLAASKYESHKCEISDSAQLWLDSHTIDSRDAYPTKLEKAIKVFQEKFYTFPSDISYEVIGQTPTEVKAEDFPGPKVKFAGTPIATIMTGMFYDNATDLLNRVDSDTGMVHESAYKSSRFDGFGGFLPDWGGYHDAAYTRLRGLTLLSNMGFQKKVNTSIAFFDKWLMYFPKSFPEIQLGGKPVPGHAPVIANKPHLYFDELRHVGWPTKYTTRDFGNPENDGHGMLMLTRWRAWIKQGRTKDWVDDRWEALNEAAEYIPWCLDNPELSFSEHGVLYSESEGGMQIASLYCDWPCYLGMLGYAEMAEVSGRGAKAVKWRQQAKRLFDAMEAYYPAEIAPWGDVWDPAKTANWNYQQGVLGPLVNGMDYYGYDVANKLPPGWADRTIRSAKMQSKYNKPRGAASAGMGYGQGFITQTALLTDQMTDAHEMIQWMAKLCFAPRSERPYLVPEGAIVAENSTMWRRWGDLGNLYQLNEILYTIHLLIGIDDLSPDQLLLMPRIPVQWTSTQIKDWPVRSNSNGVSSIVPLSFELTRKNKGSVTELKINLGKPIDSAKVRMGPFRLGALSHQTTCNGRNVDAQLETIGDSKWIWLTIGDSKTKSFTIKTMIRK